jgi:ferric-dicitrate binding protein FerR (iron transport regulator)
MGDLHVSDHMRSKARRAACERARVWAALLPDGELSLFEQRLLEAHCAHCAECRHVLESISGLTEIIRATTPDEMDRQVRILRPRPAWRSASGVAASVSAAAFALALAFWVGPQRAHPGQSPTSTAPVIVFTPESSTTVDSAAIWELKRGRGDAPVRGGDARRPGPILK